MGRLACHADGEQMPLGAILYRQFDLAEWLTGSAIESLYASIHEQLAANASCGSPMERFAASRPASPCRPARPSKIAMN